MPDHDEDTMTDENLTDENATDENVAEVVEADQPDPAPVSVADELRRILPDPGGPCPEDLTRDDLWAAVKALRHENGSRRIAQRAAEKAAAAGATADGMAEAHRLAMTSAGELVERATLRAAAVTTGATGKQAEAVATLAGASLDRAGLDPGAPDYLDNLAAACEASVAEVVDDLPALAGPTPVAPPIAQGTRGVGATPPASPDVWLRQELVNARSR